MASLQKAATKHFLNYDLGVPWDFDNTVEGDKISVKLIDSSLTKLNSEESMAEFTVRITCTVSTDGLYDLAALSGKVALVLQDELQVDGSCAASPIQEDVKISYFDEIHGYKQSLMMKKFIARLRG
jgi:hypothetical protein